MTGSVRVIDTSAIINCKRVVRADAQWPLFEQLKALVEEGQLCFPRQVADELRQERHHDTPEVWALYVGGLVKHAYEPDTAYVSQVMSLAGDVVDPDAENDPGDPYVLAQALQVRESGHTVIVVTDDVIDRPPKISMATACGRFDPPLSWVSLTDFLSHVRAVS